MADDIFRSGNKYVDLVAHGLRTRDTSYNITRDGNQHSWVGKGLERHTR